MPIRKYKHVPEPGIIRFDAGDSGVSTRWNCVVPKGRDGAPRYVRVGASGAISTSETGASGSWTVRTSGTSNMLNFVDYDSHTAKYRAVGENGTMLSSADGITWAAVSLPAGVATHNLTGIASNQAGTFVVSNSSDGNGQLYSTDGAGVTWSTSSCGASLGGWCVGFMGTTFLIGRTSNGTHRVITYSSNVAGGAWAEAQIAGGTDTVSSITFSSVNRIIAGNNGFVATCPVGSTASAANWTVRASGTSSVVRAFAANNAVYLIGASGAVRESFDDGETFSAGPSSGVSSFLRHGVHDPSNPTRALIVGDSGVTLFGQYGLRVKGYADDDAREDNDPIAQSPQFAFADQPVTDLTVDLI